MVKLVLVRHGESIANATNVYTGWNDVPLTKMVKSRQKKRVDLFSKYLIFIPRTFTPQFCRGQ